MLWPNFADLASDDILFWQAYVWNKWSHIKQSEASQKLSGLIWWPTGFQLIQPIAKVTTHVTLWLMCRSMLQLTYTQSTYEEVTQSLQWSIISKTCDGWFWRENFPSGWLPASRIIRIYFDSLVPLSACLSRFMCRLCILIINFEESELQNFACSFLTLCVKQCKCNALFVNIKNTFLVIYLLCKESCNLLMQMEEICLSRWKPASWMQNLICKKAKMSPTKIFISKVLLWKPKTSFAKVSLQMFLKVLWDQDGHWCIIPSVFAVCQIFIIK